MFFSSKVSFRMFISLQPFLTRFSLSLVSHATPASALTAVDVKIFRHEFITIFRFSEATSLHPADICILEPIDEQLTRYEEENETVFLAKDLVDKLRKMTDPRRIFQSRRCSIRRQRRW